ncbi:DUF4139 domain-containing protein [Planococcus sp. YIM B11945]|uniref:DUF4139 domain-containing protein n=1 Tax=Planococcus sp. YIM B11945 TaxID=3435410 RepID=UPI003D7CEC2F
MRFHSTIKDQQSLKVVIYQNGFAAITEGRTIPAEEQFSEIQLAGIPRTIEADSLVIHGLHVLEQNIDNDIPNALKLLERFIGQEISVRNPATGQKLNMRLLSAANGIIGEQVDTKEIILNPAGELVLPPMPEGALVEPSILLKIDPASTAQNVQLAYLARGIEWQTSYTANIRGEALELFGWANIRNDTGISFCRADVKLIAGNVYRQLPERAFSKEAMLYASSGNDPQPQEQSFADYYIYPLGQTAELLNGQLTRFRLLKFQNMPFRKVYEVNKWSECAQVKVKFKCQEAILPKGNIHVYEEGLDGGLEFIGEGEMAHIPKDEQASFAIGDAFDVLSKSWEAKREKREGYEYVTHLYEVKNRKKETVRLLIDHDIDEAAWKMETSTHDYEVKNSGKVEFRVRVPAGKSVRIEFTFKVDKQ